MVLYFSLEIYLSKYFWFIFPLKIGTGGCTVHCTSVRNEILLRSFCNVYVLKYLEMKYFWQRSASYFSPFVPCPGVACVDLDKLDYCSSACKHSLGAISYKKSYWLQVKIFSVIWNEILFRPPFTASDPMKVYNIILRGFDQIDVPRHVSRYVVNFLLWNKRNII